MEAYRKLIIRAYVLKKLIRLNFLYRIKYIEW